MSLNDAQETNGDINPHVIQPAQKNRFTYYHVSTFVVTFIR